MTDRRQSPDSSQEGPQRPLPGLRRPKPRSDWSMTSLGVEMVVSVVIGMAIGYGADSWLGTEPWLLLVGLMFGIAAAFMPIVRLLRQPVGGGSGARERRDDGETKRSG